MQNVNNQTTDAGRKKSIQTAEINPFFSKHTHYCSNETKQNGEWCSVFVLNNRVANRFTVS